MKALIDNLSDSIEVTAQNVLPGYIRFLDFKGNFQRLSLEDIYQKFHEAMKEKNDPCIHQAD